MAIEYFTEVMMFNLRRVRFVPVLWLILWMLVIPLIHVHPDADQPEGIADYVHGGVFHTVFSPALEGEYGHHAQEHDAPVIQPPVLPFLGASASLLSHPEIGFSFLSSSSNRPFAKQAMANLVLVEFNVNLLTHPCCLTRQDIFPAPTLMLLANDLSGRAPPATSV